MNLREKQNLKHTRIQNFPMVRTVIQLTSSLSGCEYSAIKCNSYKSSLSIQNPIQEFFNGCLWYTSKHFMAKIFFFLQEAERDSNRPRRTRNLKRSASRGPNAPRRVSKTGKPAGGAVSAIAIGPKEPGIQSVEKEPDDANTESKKKEDKKDSEKKEDKKDSNEDEDDNASTVIEGSIDSSAL